MWNLKKYATEMSLSTKQKKSPKCKNKLTVTKGSSHSEFSTRPYFPREIIWIFSFKNNLSNQLATMPRKAKTHIFYAMSRLPEVPLNFSKLFSIETYHYILEEKS